VKASSRRWLQRHVSDPFVKRAQKEGYRARSAYKLLEIDARDRLLRPGMTVVDLGAAPGGWSQVAAAKVRPGGTVVAVDLLEMAPVSGVVFIRGDFRAREVMQALNGEKADLVLSDLSPNISGIAHTDQARAAALVEAALEFCRAALKPEGAFLVKVFQGSAFENLREKIKGKFKQVEIRKPGASRRESRETYLLARGLREGAA